MKSEKSKAENTIDEIDDLSKGFKRLNISQKKLLGTFKKSFSLHFKNSIPARSITYSESRINRRLDSLARLLEQNEICAAVTYDSIAKKILISTNKIYKGSQSKNQYIKNIERVMDLLADHKADIETIIDTLSEVTMDNLFQEERSLWGADKEEVRNLLKELFTDLFTSGKLTKNWRNNFDQDSLKEEYSVNEKLIDKIVHKVSRFGRDFSKLRIELIEASECSTNSEMFNSINKLNYKILKTGKKDAHAEIRIVDKKRDNPNIKSSYVGISKLCCAHCGLSVDVTNTPVRGKQGRGFKWTMSESILSTPKSLKGFMGKEAYSAYQDLSDKNKKIAIDYIENEVEKPKGTKNRSMLAESSDSDVEFGVSDSDDDDSFLDRKNMTFSEVNSLSNIKKYYFKELDRLVGLGLTEQRIVNLYLESKEKFKALGSNRIYDLIQEENDPDLFEKLNKIYDNDPDTFDSIFHDERNLISEHGLECFLNEYNDVLRCSVNNSENESDEEGVISSIERKLRSEEGGWDYDYNSDDSANPWGYKSDYSDNDKNVDQFSGNNSNSEAEDDDIDESLGSEDELDKAIKKDCNIATPISAHGFFKQPKDKKIEKDEKITKKITFKRN